MYGLKSEYEAAVFVGRSLISITFTSNMINLEFDENLSITMLGSFVQKYSEDDTEVLHTVSESHSNLMQLINGSVCLSQRDDNGGLILKFSNGQILIVLDDSEEYESYTVRIGKQEIVV